MQPEHIPHVLVGLFLYSIAWFFWKLVRIRSQSYFRSIPEANANGTFDSDPSLYAHSQFKAEEHLRVQRNMAQQARGKPFYCNTFTGWKREYYDYVYETTLEAKNPTVSQLSEKEARKVQRKKQKAKNLNLESRVHENKAYATQQHQVQRKGE